MLCDLDQVVLPPELMLFDVGAHDGVTPVLAVTEAGAERDTRGLTRAGVVIARGASTLGGIVRISSSDELQFVTFCSSGSSRNAMTR